MATLPERATAMAAESSFCFHCHPGVACFTDCCRDLELALSPYDILRLKQALALSAQEVLERYAVIEFGPDDLYPKVYLAMVDDGRASCPFVSATGCQVYADRPGACRTYPVGRGASLDQNGQPHEQFVIIQEDHCQGFSEERRQSVRDWQSDQQINDFNRMNDLLLPLLARTNANRSMQRLTSEEATLFLDTVFDLERFTARLAQHPSPPAALPAADQTALLCCAIDWLKEQWQSAR